VNWTVVSEFFDKCKEGADFGRSWGGRTRSKGERTSIKDMFGLRKKKEMNDSQSLKVRPVRPPRLREGRAREGEPASGRKGTSFRNFRVRRKYYHRGKVSSEGGGVHLRRHS